MARNVIRVAPFHSSLGKPRTFSWKSGCFFSSWQRNFNLAFTFGSGITAAQFNTPAQTAAFATAIEDSLTIDATVTNVVATDIARRRLKRRQLLQSGGVDVSYDLQVAILDDGMRILIL